jgi:hypothetical protein
VDPGGSNGTGEEGWAGKVAAQKDGEGYYGKGWEDYVTQYYLDKGMSLQEAVAAAKHEIELDYLKKHKEGYVASKPIVPLGGTFKLANQPAPHRLVVAVDGMDKEGKTNFALTAPGPIAYHDFDIGGEGVIQKFQTDKTIFQADYGVKLIKGEESAAVMKKAGPVWDNFINNWKLMLAGMENGTVRTGILDTAGEAWEYLRLARLGKLTQIMPHHYTALNAEFRALIKDVFDTTGSLVLLHKLKAEWKNDAAGKGNKTGNMERAGFSETGFLVQINTRAWRDYKTGDFHLTVTNCRQNPEIAGLDLVNDMCTFPTLATFVYPDTKPEDWM